MMNKVSRFLLCLVLFLIVWAQLNAYSTEFEEETDCRQILSKLQLKAESGIQNADLFYNLGVCHYHLGNTGQAVLWFLRAQNLNSAHTLAKQNLDYVHSLIPQESQKKPTPYLTRLFLDIYDFFSLNRLAVITLILALLMSLCLHWLLHYPPEKERGLPILILSITGVLFLSFFSALLIKQHRFMNNHKAVVMRENTEVFATPSLQRRLEILPEGYILKVKEAPDSLSQVILGEGTNCWVRSANIESVIPKR